MSTTQVCDNGEYPTVVVAGVGDLELLEDGSHVCLDGSLCDDQASCDRGIGAPLRDEFEHLELACRQRGELIIAPSRRNQRTDHRRVER